MKKFTGIKAVVFDLDNTLYDETEYFSRVFRAYCRNQGCPNKVPVLLKVFIAQRLSSRDIFADCLRRAGFAGSVNEDREELFKLYCSLRTMVRPYPDATPLLKRLKKMNLKLGILTNGVIEAQKNKVRSLGLEPYFDKLVFARQCGRSREKPYALPFKNICRQLKVSGKDTVFVGDNPLIDFKGAKLIGGVTIRIKRGLYRKLPAGRYIDLEINELGKIKDCL